MSNDNVIKLIQSGTFDDQLTERSYATERAHYWPRRVKAEVAEFLGRHAEVESDFESPRHFPDFASGFFDWTQGPPAFPKTARRLCRTKASYFLDVAAVMEKSLRVGVDPLDCLGAGKLALPPL